MKSCALRLSLPSLSHRVVPKGQISFSPQPSDVPPRRAAHAASPVSTRVSPGASAASTSRGGRRGARLCPDYCFHFLQVNIRRWDCGVIQSIFNALRNLHAISHGGCTQSAARQLFGGVSFSPHSRLLLSCRWQPF